MARILAAHPVQDVRPAAWLDARLPCKRKSGAAPGLLSAPGFDHSRLKSEECSAWAPRAPRGGVDTAYLRRSLHGVEGEGEAASKAPPSLTLALRRQGDRGASAVAGRRLKWHLREIGEAVDWAAAVGADADALSTPSTIGKRHPARQPAGSLDTLRCSHGRRTAQDGAAEEAVRVVPVVLLVSVGDRARPPQDNFHLSQRRAHGFAVLVYPTRVEQVEGRDEARGTTPLWHMDRARAIAQRLRARADQVEDFDPGRAEHVCERLPMISSSSPSWSPDREQRAEMHPGDRAELEIVIADVERERLAEREAAEARASEADAEEVDVEEAALVEIAGPGDPDHDAYMQVIADSGAWQRRRLRELGVLPADRVVDRLGPSHRGSTRERRPGTARVRGSRRTATRGSPSSSDDPDEADPHLAGRLRLSPRWRP